MSAAIASLAAMDEASLLAAFEGLFEHSPWVAQAAWKSAPFETAGDLHDAMMRAVRSAPLDTQIAFLCMHPELAGKEAQAGTMTGHSTFEQHGAGLNHLDREEFADLQRLNAAYRARHGFPFIIAVLGHTKPQIFAALRSRTEQDTPAEIEASLAQIATITRRRLDALMAETSNA